jgi:hypothetical protein
MTALGPIVNDIAGVGATHELIGGIGSYRWKQLINGIQPLELLSAEVYANSSEVA